MNEPNLVDKAKNLTGAMVNWASQDGFSKVSPEVFHSRKQFCDNCPFWDPFSFLSL